MPKQPVGLVELSAAIMAAGERTRAERAKRDAARAKKIKQCPCAGKVCQEKADGGYLCPPGVCVRMN